jgi:hypothetical protein
MKKFNQQIEVSFSVDTVATMLLEKISPEFAHRELLVENIIAPMISNNQSGDRRRLGSVISALFGVRKELDITVGSTMFCTEEYYQNGNYLKKGSCTILEVDPHKDGAEVQIEYYKEGKDGTLKVETCWVNVNQLTNMSVDPATGVATIGTACQPSF